MHFGNLHWCITFSSFCPRYPYSSLIDRVLELFVTTPDSTGNISIDVDPGYFVRAELIRKGIKRLSYLDDPDGTSFTCTRAPNWIFPHVYKDSTMIV